MEFVRLSGRNFLINGKHMTTEATEDGDILYNELEQLNDIDNFQADEKDMEVVNYLIEGFSNWAFGDRYYLEPGFRHIVKKEKKEIFVCYKKLRKDWHDECMEALDKWENALSGLKFISVNRAELADVVIDDEVKGAYAQKRYCFTGRYKNGKPIINSVAREINIWKEWPEFNIEEAILHEIGHVLGLGHPGPYNGSRPAQPMYEKDHASHTCMSYYGTTEEVGELDKLALKMIYE